MTAKVRILNKQNKLLIEHRLLPSHQHWLYQVWRNMFNQRGVHERSIFCKYQLYNRMYQQDFCILFSVYVYLFCLLRNLTFVVIYLVKNRMRNIHALITSEFGRENITILRRWEHLEKKIANFSNHRRFTLRCLSQNITPNSLKRKSNIKTLQGVKNLQRIFSLNYVFCFGENLNLHYVKQNEKPTHAICNFVQVKGIKLQPNECVASYDVSAPFTSI